MLQVGPVFGSSEVRKINPRNYLRRRAEGLRWRFEMVRNHLFDFRWGVETRLASGLADAGVSARQALQGNNIYRPIWISEFRRLMRAVAVDPAKFTLVDFGSGKAKLLLLAARHGFRKVVGVEYAPGLHRVAMENIKHFKEHSRCRSEIIGLYGDAREFELPRGPLVIIMFNPFDADITRAVVERIEVDWRREPREIHLVYGNRRDVAEIGDGFSDVRILKLKRFSRYFLLFHASGGE